MAGSEHARARGLLRRMGRTMARILYVDCCQERVAEVCSLLQGNGHQVQTVSSAERAMLHVHNGESYEAVVMYLFLPGIDGAELSRWLAGPALPGNMVELAFTCQGERTPMAAGAELPKWLPVDRFLDGIEGAQDLVAAVEELLRQRV